MVDEKKPDFRADRGDVESEIRKLTDRKTELIDRVRKISKGIKYKTIEVKALEPLEAQAEKENPFILIRKLKKLEFRLSTQASTPKMEKAMMKEIIDLERQIRKVKPLLTASSRIRRVREDLRYYESEMVKVESELKGIRERLRELIGKRKIERAQEKRDITYEEENKEEEHFISLEDMADKD